MRIVIPGLVLLFTIVARLNATDYFVDYAEGSDFNLGTNPSASWKHCPGDPSAGALAAAFSLFPGDTVHFKGGVSYVFRGATGIALNWDGVSGNVITYDGNSDGKWGSGRAIFTDNNGLRSITAFSSKSVRRNLSFQSLEIASIGGASILPLDLGLPLGPKFGGGFAFNGGAENVSIDDCVFRALGYWFNQKPLSGFSLAGTGISSNGASGLSITNCDFSRVAKGCDFSAAASYSNLQIQKCTFRDFILWPIDLPAGSGGSVAGWLSVADSTFLNDGFFSASSWSGYGSDPRTEVTTAAAGSTVVIAAAAISSPAANFQWFKNGSAIPSATGAALQLGAIGATDAATYTVVASNGGGAITSNSVVLVVTGLAPTAPSAPSAPPGGQSVAPVITAQPQSQIVSPLALVTFGVTATGAPTPGYQWQKNGVAIAGATGAVLNLLSVTALDSANYTVLVTNSAGTVVSNAASLSVQIAPPGSLPTEPSLPLPVAPVILIPPVGQVVTRSDTVTFTVVAAGAPSPSYQWQKNGANLAGFTGAQLRIDSVASADEGVYAVVVSNTAGSVTSASATLTVNAPPAITVQPVSQTATTSNSVTFTVLANGTPAPSYQWFKNGISLFGLTGTQLRMDSVTSNDQGAYTVVVSNAAGSVTSASAMLTVNVPPTIALYPVTRTVTALTAVTFSVVANGTPPFTYQWLKDGMPIDWAMSATITYPSVSKWDVANYSVVVRNAAGSTTSPTFALYVDDPVPSSVPPVITQQPVNQVAPTSGTATFAVAATGAPSPAYLWRKDGAPIAGATNATLTLGSVTSKDVASYSVVVSNSGGAVTSNSVTLTLNDPPSAPPGGLVPAGAPVQGLPIFVSMFVSTSVPANVGFQVTGDVPKKILIRAAGPTIAAFGGTGTISDPFVEIYRGSGRLSANDNWGGGNELINAVSQAGTFPFVSLDSKDAAFIVTLAPGTYNIVASGVGGVQGTVLIEAHEVP